MRFPLNVTFATLLLFAAATGCGATAAQRRSTAMVTMAAGAAVFAAGAIMSHREDDNDCPADGNSLCLDLVNENAIGGGLLMFGGGALAVGGLIGLAASAPTEAAPPPPSPVVDADASDCIEWKRELDSETDPARRGALHAIRPAHCPRPDVSAAR